MTRPPAPAGSVLIAAGAVISIEALAYALVLPHLPLVVAEQAPWWTVGFLFAGYSTAQFIALGPIARLAERLGAPIVIAGCLAGTIVGLILTAISTNYWVLLSGRIIDGASAGTVAVVTAATLSWHPQHRWAALLGRLGGVRGAAALIGVVVTAAAGWALDDPGRGLSTMAWVGTGLAAIALIVVPRLRPRAWAPDASTGTVPITAAARRSLAVHVAVTSAVAGLVVLAPAAASAVSSARVGIVAPAAAIIGLGIGQVLLAGMADRSGRLRAAMLGLLAAGVAAALFTPTVLAGFAIAGVAIGSYAPGAQAVLIRQRIADGQSEVAANAFAGRGAILGQITGPVLGYAGLGWSTGAAVGAVAAVGSAGSRRR